MNKKHMIIGGLALLAIGGGLWYWNKTKSEMAETDSKAKAAAATKMATASKPATSSPVATPAA